MIIGIGKGPLSYFVWKYMSEYVCNPLYPYPLFYNAKRDLLTNKHAYINYLRKLQLRRKEVKIAVYPDYIPPNKVHVNLSILKSIEFIVPIHSLEDLAIAAELEALGFNIYYGFASEPHYRSYTLNDFIRAVKGKKWYLGISTKRELQEALNYGFDGADITGFLFGKNEDRKNALKLRRMLTDFLKQVSKPQGRQSSILEFFPLNWGV